MRPISARPVRHPSARLAVAAAVLAPLALTACTADSSGAASDDKAGGAKAGGKPAAVTVTPAGQTARAGEPIRVTARGGTLTSVAVTDGKGKSVGGTLSEGNTVWTSERRAAPGATYRVTAGTTTEGGTKGTEQASFSTAKAERTNTVDWWPGTRGTDGTVGVAQPISLAFDHPVTNKAEVEKQLKVVTSNDTEGSWGWVKEWNSGRDRIDWRPKEYWKPGTKVTLKAPLSGIDSGNGRWFVRDYDNSFTVGARQEIKVDLDSYKLTLERDGKTVRTIPISGGDPNGDTRTWKGIMPVMVKEGTVNMRSETVGLGDAYDKMVKYSARLTWSGLFVHAAPWNARYFGNENASSGCIGMSTENASTFYAQIRQGDPVTVTGKDTKGIPDQGNGFSNWNVSYEEWKKRSALS
ncbi:Ig-like domain-containing protein [Streptomyces clavuligerus]|nr:Ig-like domain-containing protein [Streptomyces clavuligerus]WDN55141.1 Ig-like domain-containing protein [Streptomyces clavuligerus]